MRRSTGYSSTSDYGAHFGLGDLAVIPRIEIDWPSGATQVLEHVKADQELKVIENKER